jgi:hypothetical protein
MALASCAPQGATAQSLFPLKVGPGARHLVDQADKPFYVNGEAAWSITHNYTYAEAVTYLQNRRDKGFNALMISVPDAYARDGGASYPPDRQGQQPFVSNDITRPNEAYWQNVDNVLAKAEEMGFLVLYWPYYLGCCNDGYAALFRQNGVDKAREYGRFVGRRYGGHKNLIWVHGGDLNPGAYSDLVLAVKAGIQDVGPARLHATHWGPETDPYGPFGESFTDLYLTYTYNAVSALVSRHYNHAPTKPVILLETHYENDWASKPSSEVVKYPYRAVFSGAAGYFFGNKPLWFSGYGWETAMESPGSKAMKWVGMLFASRPWHTMQPATAAVVASGGGDPLTDEGVQAARAADRSFAMAFLAYRRTVGITMSALSGSTVRAWWVNVMSGGVSLIGDFPASGVRSFAPPSDGSWVLVLDDASRGYGTPGQSVVVSLTGVSPSTGPLAGGTLVTLTGGGFSSGATVTFGGTAATSVTHGSPTTLTAVTPARPAGIVDVSVTVPGLPPATLAQSFAYVAPPPPPVATGFFTVPPCRAVDTRQTRPLAAQERLVFSLATCNVPADANAVAVNLTATQASAVGHLRAAAGDGLTDSSTLNFTAGVTRANNAVVPLASDGTGTVSVRNISAGLTHLLIDVFGYFK